MIISASYKTDIPAFYGEWFMNRLNAGYCKMVNPYNRQVYRINLGQNDVDGFVFWTKNLKPFLTNLNEIHNRGYPFVVQYTINAYSRQLEFSVVNAKKSVEHMKRIANEFGPKVAVWRYDPVVFTSITSIDFHRRNFEALARKLQGTTDEVVISFAQIYKKTKRNMDWAANEFKFDWSDPDDEFKYNLATELASIAKSYRMQLKMCSQKQYLAPGVEEARCVDAQRLMKISMRPLVAKLKGNRPDCGCFASRDIGDYDTCPHGCVYCYAVQNRELAQSRYKAHDPESEFLFTPNNYVEAKEVDKPPKDKDDNIIQLKLIE